MNDPDQEVSVPTDRPRVIEIRADELRLEDILEEGVKVVSLRAENDGESPIWVTTTNRVASTIVWPRDHMVRVVRGPRRPGLGFKQEGTW